MSLSRATASREVAAHSLKLEKKNKPTSPYLAQMEPHPARVGLTGTRRQGKLRSYVPVVLTFSAAATVPRGARYRHVETNTIWEVTDDDHEATEAGELDAVLTALEPGPTEAVLGSEWTAVTVIAGVVGVTNPTHSAVAGRLREEDPSLRRRQIRELNEPGQGPFERMRQAILKIEGVLGCRIYHNTSDYPADADGIPFKALNVVVETSPAVPTAEQQAAIADAIWRRLGGGGQAFGTDYNLNVTDSEGRPHGIGFDVVTVLDIAIDIRLLTSTSEDAVSPGAPAVVAAAVLKLALEKHQVSGRDVQALDYKGEVARLQEAGLVTGVDGVEVRLAIHPAVATEVTKLPIGIRERAAFDAARLHVEEE